MSENQQPDTGTYVVLLRYLSAIKRRGWIVLLAMVVAGAAAYLIAHRETPTYRASSQVLITASDLSVFGGGAGGNQNSAQSQARYVATQAQVASTPAVTLGATKLLHPPLSISEIHSMLTVAANPATNVLTFSATDASPAVAANVANAQAAAFVIYRKTQDISIINTALRSVSAQIDDVNNQINALKASGQGTSPSLTSELTKLVSKRSGYENMLAVDNKGDAVVAQHATSASQVTPDIKKDVLLGVGVGLLLGVGLAVLRELLDTKVRASDEVTSGLGLPLLARLATPGRKLRDPRTVVMLSGSPEDGEQYRKLRLNTEFANLNVKARSIVITSSLAGEGKSTTVANLGAAFALTGKRVVLLDLDLRRPMLSEFFGVPGEPGVTGVMLGHVRLDDALVQVNLSGKTVGIDAGELYILPSGPIPPNPAEFIETPGFGQLIDDLTGISDIVLIDSAPLLPVSDTIALSRIVDAMVVIARATVVTRPALRELKRVLSTCGAAKLGVVLTGAESEPGYGYSSYYGSYAALPRQNGHPTAQRKDPASL